MNVSKPKKIIFPLPGRDLWGAMKKSSGCAQKLSLIWVGSSTKYDVFIKYISNLMGF